MYCLPISDPQPWSTTFLSVKTVPSWIRVHHPVLINSWYKIRRPYIFAIFIMFTMNHQIFGLPSRNEPHGPMGYWKSFHLVQWFYHIFPLKSSISRNCPIFSPATRPAHLPCPRQVRRAWEFQREILQRREVVVKAGLHTCHLANAMVMGCVIDGICDSSCSSIPPEISAAWWWCLVCFYSKGKIGLLKQGLSRASKGYMNSICGNLHRAKLRSSINNYS